MGVLHEPGGQGEGDARRFKESLQTAWDFLASYETSEPILTLTFDDGRTGAVEDLPDVAAALYGYLVDWYDPPGDATISADAVVMRTDPGFNFSVGYVLGEHDDDETPAVLLTFNDDTRLIADLEPVFKPADSWVTAIAGGQVQQQIEAVVALAQVTNVVEAMSLEDRRVAEAVLELLGALAATANPPRGMVREAASWLWRKVDLFVDEAVKTGGKAAGVVAVGGAAWALHKYAPDLTSKLEELYTLAK